MNPFIKVLTIIAVILLIPITAWAISPDSSGQLQKKVKVSSNDSTSGYLNGKLVAGANVSFTEGSDGGNETLTIAATGDLGYATVDEEGTGLTQRNTINFIGSSVTCADNVANTRTDCTFNPASTVTVQEADVTKSTANTIDFNTGDFAVTESPSGEANVALGAGVLTTTGTQTLTNKTLTTPVIGAIKPVAGSNSHTVPNVASDTFALLAATQTLTGKTLNSADNTVDASKLDETALTIGTPSLNDVLKWDGAKWVNGVSPGSGYSTIQDETVARTQRSTVNFTGAGVSCVDNAGTSATDCTIAAGSVAADSLDFTEMLDSMTIDAATHIITDNTKFLGLGDGASHYIKIKSNGVTEYVGAAKPNRTIDLTPASAISPASGGATKANTDGTNFSYPQATFPNSGAAALYWTFYAMPDSYDDGNLSCQVAWKTSSTTTSDVVRWQLAIRGTANDEVFDASLGAYTNIDDSPTASAQDLCVSPATTVTANFTAGEYVVVKLYRDPADGADTSAADAIFLGLKCEYASDAESD